MKKYFVKLILFFSIVTCCSLLLSPIQASAKETKADLFYNDKEQNLMISISWEIKDATVTLIDPNGKSIDPTKATDTVSSVVSDTGMLVMVKNAAEGQWKWKYDKGSNEFLDVSVSEYKEPVWIEDYQLGAVNGSTIPFQFNTSSTESIYYNYTFTIKTGTEASATKEVYYGSANSNEQVTGTIDLSSVNSYDNYILELKVSYIEYGLEYFDVADSEAFTYTNPNKIAGVSDFEIVLDEAAGSVAIGNISIPDVYYDEILVRMYADDTTLLENAYTLDELAECSVGFGEETKEIKVGLTLATNGILSEECVKTCAVTPAETDFKMVLPDYNISNQKTYMVTYSNANQQAVTVNLNGMEDNWVLNGSGEKLIDLSDGQSELTFTYTDTANITRRYSASLSVDLYPPVLNILDNFDGMTTLEDNIVITGETETGTTVTINGTPVEVKDAGTFLYKYTLDSGENNITVSAKDDAGNETTYYACVSKKTIVESNSFLKKYFPLLTALAASILGSVLILLLTRQKKSSQIKEEGSRNEENQPKQ